MPGTSGTRCRQTGLTSHPSSGELDPVPLNRPALSLGPGPRGVQDARRWVARPVPGHRPPRPRRVRRAGGLRAGHQRPAARPSRRSPSGCAAPASTPASRSATPRWSPRCCPTPSPDGRRRRPAADLRPRPLASWPAAPTPGAPRSRTTARSSGSPPPPSRRRPGRGHHHRRRRPRRARRAAGDGRREIDILGVPLRYFVGFQRHYRELRREVRLLALAHEADYPLAKTLSDLFGSLDRQLREGIGADQIEEAAAQPARDRTDLRVAIRERRRGDRRPLHRAARPRRRLLPRGAAAVAGPHPRAARVPALVPRGVRAPRGRRAAPGLARRHAGGPVDGLSRPLRAVFTRSRGGAVARRRCRSGARSRGPR